MFIWKGDVFELTESYQKLQRIVSTTQGYQISCPLLQVEGSLKWWCPSLAVLRFLGPAPTDWDSANMSDAQESAFYVSR